MSRHTCWSQMLSDTFLLCWINFSFVSLIKRCGKYRISATKNARPWVQGGAAQGGQWPRHRGSAAAFTQPGLEAGSALVCPPRGQLGSHDMTQEVHIRHDRYDDHKMYRAIMTIYGKNVRFHIKIYISIPDVTRSENLIMCFLCWISTSRLEGQLELMCIYHRSNELLSNRCKVLILCKKKKKNPLITREEIDSWCKYCRQVTLKRTSYLLWAYKCSHSLNDRKGGTGQMIF